MDIERRLSDLEAQVKLLEGYSVAAFWKALDAAYALALPHREFRCLVCDHRDRRDGFRLHTDRCQFGGGVLERYQCPGCDAIFGAQKYLDLDEEFVMKDYELLYSRYSESDNTANELRAFASLKPHGTGKYLNWGCGYWSKSVSVLRERGSDVWGFEPTAPTAADFILNRRADIPAGLDGIFSNNVIEHFRDPIAQFRDFRSLLKPGGKMAHATPCYEYRYAFTRFHTLFLLGRSPHVLAERTGFRAEEVERQGEYINFVFTAIDAPGR